MLQVRDAGDDAPAADVEEDAAAATAGDDSDDDDDGLDSLSQSGMECELCLSEPRDTMILPCRHLSICSSCGEWRGRWNIVCVTSFLSFLFLFSEWFTMFKRANVLQAN